MDNTTDLNSFFFQINFHGQFFSQEDIRVMRLLEGVFQFLQLFLGKDRPVSSLPFVADSGKIGRTEEAGEWGITYNNDEFT